MLQISIPILLLLAGATLGLGLIGPCMTLIPGFGELDGWARLFIPDDFTTPRTYSILTGIEALWNEGQRGIAALLFAFSVCFPILKIGVMGYGHAVVASGRRAGKALWLAHHGGKFSMLDVLVVAVLVIAIKGMPGDSEVVLGWGLWSFAASVVLSIVAAIAIAYVEKHEQPGVATENTEATESET